MGKKNNLLKKGKANNKGGGPNLLAGAKSVFHNKVHGKKGDKNALNVREEQALILAQQPQCDIFNAEGTVSNAFLKASTFKLKINSNEVEVLDSIILDLAFRNTSTTAALEMPMFVHDALDKIDVMQNGKTVQTIHLSALFTQQRATQDNQLVYDNYYKPGILMGGDLAAGETRHIYLPIDCVFTRNHVYVPALAKDITMAVSTKSTGWPTTSRPQLLSAELIVSHSDFSEEQQGDLDKQYKSGPVDFKFYSSQVHGFTLNAIKPLATNTYQITGLIGVVNCLTFVMKPAADSVISEWCSDMIESFEILDAGNNSITGNTPITRKYYENYILHKRDPVRLVDADAHDKFLTWDFSNFREDLLAGSCTGFEVMDGSHSIRLTFSSDLVEGNYELDIISYHYDGVRIEKGRVDVVKA
jgi:hypothetical protein